jgi:hypothetical protein
VKRESGKTSSRKLDAKARESETAAKGGGVSSGRRKVSS